jgi:urocanate hydratase
MKAKLLNLQDALRLASILDKYIDEKTNANAEALDFVSAIIDKIDPISFLHCVNILSGETEEQIKKQISIDILTCFVEGLQENKVLSLISFYRSIGLNK